MSYATRIISRFGGTRRMSRALGIAPSTIQSWKTAGHIPAKHHGRLLTVAAREGIELGPADFFDLPQPPAPAHSRAAE